MQKIEGTSSIASLLSCFTISQLHTHDLRLARTTYGTKNQAHTHTTPFRPRFASRTLSEVERGPKSIEHADAPDLARSEVHRGSVRTRNVGGKRREPGHDSPRKDARSCGRFASTWRKRLRETFCGRRATTYHGCLRRISRRRVHRRSCGRRTHVRGKEPFLRGYVTVAGSGRGRVHFCRWHTPSSLPCFANTLPAENQRRCISLKSCDRQERKPRYHQLPQNTHIKQVQVDR